MKHIVFYLLVQLTTLFLSAQQVQQPLNPLQTGIGTYTPHQFNAFSFCTNQAALANASALMAGIYGERRFMLQDLGWYQVATVLPTPSGNFGIKGTYFGNMASSTKELGLAYGRKLGSKIAIGAQFNYYTQQIAQYGSLNNISIEGGILLKVSNQLQTGFHIYNPVNVSLGKTNEKLSTVYTVGFGYEASEQFALTAEVQKVEDEKINIRANISYQFDKKLVARAGLNSNNAVYSLGLGVQLSAIRLEPTVSLHPHLGLTPGLSLLFHKKEKAL